MRSDQDASQVGAHRLTRALAFGLAVATPIGFLLALIFQWPSDFVLDEASVNHRVTAADIVSGTVTSMPLPPFFVLVLAGLTAGSTRWWGTVALMVLALLGVVFTIGGAGEIASDNPNVPKTVLVVAGVVYVLVGLALAAAALTALWQRLRRHNPT